MRKILFVCGGALLLIQVHGATAVASGDFSRATQRFQTTESAGKGSFQGSLPANWQENFISWTKSRVSTVSRQENAAGYLRFQVHEISGAAPQFLCRLPNLSVGRVYRMSISARNRAPKDATLSLRMIPAPYKTYATIHLPPGGEWKNFSRIIKWEKSATAPSGLFLTLNAPGEFDVRNILLEELTPAEAKAEAEVKKTILRTVFFLDGKESAENGKGSFHGVLPAPWRQDYTHWNPARAASEIINRGPEQFLRLNVEKGSPQFLAPLQGIRAKRTYRLTAYVRNGTGGPVKMSLRLLPPPYTTLSAGSWKRGDSWSTQTLYFKTPAFQESLPVGLLMNIDGPGTLDLATLKLEEFDGAVAALRRPSPRQKNFLHSTRFPLGLPAGWNLMRGHTAGSVTASPERRGPSGEPALLLLSREKGKIGICSAPFQVAEPEKRHTLSFSCSGTGDFLAEIQCEGKRLAALPLRPEEKWKRLSLDFTAPRNALALTFRIHGTGAMTVDAFRIAPSGDALYLPGAPCEIALALPDSEMKESGIQFDDEPAQIRYAVTGDCSGGTLCGRIVNLYGESVTLPPLPLSEGNTSGSIGYLRFPDRELGQFRLELEVRKNDRPLSPPAELIVTRISRPKYWKRDAPDSPFGIHVLPDAPSLRAVKAAGMNWVRLHDAGTEYTGWFYLEPEKGKWLFRDAEIRAYRQNHLKIFGQLGTAPRWASYLSKAAPDKQHASYHDRYFQPLRQEDFRNYVSTVVKRYRGCIDDWFVWNEPWVPAWWGIGYAKDTRGGAYATSSNPQADFAALTRTAFEAAKKENPAVRISGFNTTAGKEGSEWTKGVLEAGGLAACDTVDFHFYTERKTGFPGDACGEAWRQALGPLMEGRAAPCKPVLLSEGQGASLGSAAGDTSMRYAGMHNLSLPWKNEEDFNSVAERNVRYIVSFLSLGVRRIFLYSAHCYSDFSQAPSFLVLFNANGTPHPMLAACSAMTKHLEGKRFSGTEPMGNGAWSHLFTDGTTSTAVIIGRAAASDRQWEKAARKMKFYDLYGNPVKRPVPGQEVLYAELPGNSGNVSVLFQS